MEFCDTPPGHQPAAFLIRIGIFDTGELPQQIGSMKRGRNEARLHSKLVFFVVLAAIR
jgi:hypothetical protein